MVWMWMDFWDKEIAGDYNIKASQNLDDDNGIDIQGICKEWYASLIYFRLVQFDISGKAVCI